MNETTLTTCKLLLSIYKDRRRLRHGRHDHLTGGRIHDGDAGGGERAVGLGHLGWLRLKWESFSLSTQTLAPWLGWEDERRR